jgi:hypothetical protein
VSAVLGSSFIALSATMRTQPSLLSYQLQARLVTSSPPLGAQLSTASASGHVQSSTWVSGILCGLGLGCFLLIIQQPQGSLSPKIE